MCLHVARTRRPEAPHATPSGRRWAEETQQWGARRGRATSAAGARNLRRGQGRATSTLGRAKGAQHCWQLGYGIGRSDRVQATLWGVLNVALKCATGRWPKAIPPRKGAGELPGPFCGTGMVFVWGPGGRAEPPTGTVLGRGSAARGRTEGAQPQSQGRATSAERQGRATSTHGARNGRATLLAAVRALGSPLNYQRLLS